MRKAKFLKYRGSDYLHIVAEYYKSRIQNFKKPEWKLDEMNYIDSNKTIREFFGTIIEPNSVSGGILEFCSTPANFAKQISSEGRQYHPGHCISTNPPVYNIRSGVMGFHMFFGDEVTITMYIPVTEPGEELANSVQFSTFKIKVKLQILHPDRSHDLRFSPLPPYLQGAVNLQNLPELKATYEVFDTNENAGILDRS